MVAYVMLGNTQPNPSDGSSDLLLDDEGSQEAFTELKILRRIHGLPRYPDEDEVEEVCRMIRDEYIRGCALPQTAASSVRITLRLKEEDAAGRPVLTRRYLVPHHRTYQHLAYPDSIAGLALLLGEVVKYPEDGDEVLDARRIHRLQLSGKLSLIDGRTKESGPEQQLRVSDFFQKDESVDEPSAKTRFVAVPIPYIPEPLAQDYTRSPEIGVLVLDSINEDADSFDEDCLRKLKRASHYLRFLLDRPNTFPQLAKGLANLETSLELSGTYPSSSYAARRFETRVRDAARRFGSFTGSMHYRSIYIPELDEARVKGFLEQFDVEREARLVLRCLDFMGEHYWDLARIEHAFLDELQPIIKSYARGRHPVYIPFGHPQDSSALLLNGPLKGLAVTVVGDLEDFLLRSKEKRSDCNSGNSIICFLDDNVATATQAPAIFKQYFGIAADEEETHVQALRPDLQEDLRHFDIIFLTFYASRGGLKLVRSQAEALGLRPVCVDTLHDCASANWLTMASEPTERAELQGLFEKYGSPLLRDKVGADWNEEKRRKYALGYGGLGQLFLFCYQTPTSIPVMFWRYGKVGGDFWQPLFWRESDYERFVKRLYSVKEHVTFPHRLWEEYQDFVGVRKARNIKLTVDQTNEFYEFVRPKLQQSDGVLKAQRGTAQFWDRHLSAFLAPPPPLLFPNCGVGG